MTILPKIGHRGAKSYVAENTIEDLTEIINKKDIISGGVDAIIFDNPELI